MNYFYCNPGTGPARFYNPTGRCSFASAYANMKALAAEVETAHVRVYKMVESRRAPIDGRWPFKVWTRHAPSGAACRYEVDMPGIPLRYVRTREIRVAPRLYVDGSSWYWEHAVDILRNHSVI